MSGDTKKEDFQRRWELIVKAIGVAEGECDPGFRDICCLQRRNESMFMETYHGEYLRRRHGLEEECYSGNPRGHILDARKMASVVCCSLIAEKAFLFDEAAAVDLLTKERARRNLSKIEERLDFNRWVVNNFFINYKTAYLAGLHVIYAALLQSLIESEERRETGRVLAERGRLYRYPSESGMDSYDVNMVLGLGRADVDGQRIDTFLLAMQYYQIEMFTRSLLGLVSAEFSTPH